MNGSTTYRKPIGLLIPLLGMLLFVFFYFKAAFVYPGGSHFAPTAEGFSFLNNYLCDLLDSTTLNGDPNPSKGLARIALFLLCSCLTVLWYYIPKLFKRKGIYLSVIRFTGISAMIITLFLSSNSHDLVVYIAGLMGMLAMIITIVALFREGYQELFALGVFCLAIFLLNFYIYESGILITVLPAIQKITFVSFIGWFSLLDISLYRKMRKPKKIEQPRESP
ncbi:hypothetical protein [Sediminicola sp. 1XM1-17]|uniref:hypothetical protein n=1 Tax=Sediminicola sp. 1XM1-17 TaxID=3127702 RepID=UPI0030773B65